jgi:membrane associated rhomboid family serine protease
MGVSAATVRDYLRTYRATVGLAGLMLVWFGLYDILLVQVVGAANVELLKQAIGVDPNAPFEVRTYLTALFSHSSARHVLVNVAGLGVGGFVLERQWGSRSVLVVFFAAGLVSIAGYVLSCSVIARCGYGLGASGGVYGLFGATVAFVVTTRPRDFQTIVAIGCLSAVSRQLLLLTHPGHRLIAGVHLTGAAVGVAVVVAKHVTWSLMETETRDLLLQCV